MFPLYDTVRSRRFPFINLMLILINVLAFLYEIQMDPSALKEFIFEWGLIPARLLSDPSTAWSTIFTSMFLHGGWLHLFSNMLALYIFGDNVEDRIGHGRYLAFYLICGIIAAITHIVFNPISPVPTIGASGAISGVLGAYFILYPRARVITLVPIFILPWIVEIPALVYLGFWFLSQLFNGVLAIAVGSQSFGGIAWWAHAGGFLAGTLLVGLFTRQRYVRRVYVDEYYPW